MATEAADQQADTSETQSTEDQAADTGAGVHAEGTSDTGSASDSGSGTESSIELIGQEEYDKLATNPVALRKALNKAATEKFQEIAEYRKVLEPHAEFFTRLEQDPQAAIRELAESIGMELGAAPAKGTDTPQPQADFGTQVVQLLRESLGEEYGEIGDRLAPAIVRIAQAVAEAQVAPLRQQNEALVRDSALRDAGAATTAFDKKNPGWRKYESAMVELSAKLHPSNMTEDEYLDVLYAVASRGTGTGASVKKVLDKMRTSAANGSEGGGTRVSSDKVTRSPVKLPTFQEAAEAAQRGERFE